MADFGDIAVVKYTGTLDDGTIFDSTEGIEPLQFVIGSGAVIHGFDDAVASMKVGERRQITVAPKDAYGLYDDSKIELGPMYAIPNAKDVKVGKPFYFRTDEGLNFPAVVLEISEGVAKIDFNHPLAGKNLNFDIELLELLDSRK